jgi:hypothetical protein
VIVTKNKGQTGRNNRMRNVACFAHPKLGMPVGKFPSLKYLEKSRNAGQHIDIYIVYANERRNPPKSL